PFGGLIPGASVARLARPAAIGQGGPTGPHEGAPGMGKRQAQLVREYLSWQEYGEGSLKLAELVADSGFRPDIILTIARGGLLVGGALSYSLQVKNVFLMNVEYYTGVGERLEFPVLLPPPLNL